MSIRVEHQFNREQRVNAISKAVMFNIVLNKNVHEYYSRYLHLTTHDNSPALHPPLFNKIRMFK